MSINSALRDGRLRAITPGLRPWPTLGFRRKRDIRAKGRRCLKVVRAERQEKNDGQGNAE